MAAVFSYYFPLMFLRSEIIPSFAFFVIVVVVVVVVLIEKEVCIISDTNNGEGWEQEKVNVCPEADLLPPH